MKNLAKMLSAQEFYAQEGIKPCVDFLDYMDFAERYADYVVDHEKFIDGTGLASVEKLENDIERIGPEKAWAVGKGQDEELICCVRNMREVLIHHETAGEERIQSEIRLASMALMAVGKAGGESAEDAWKRGVEFGVGAGVDGANLCDDAWVVPPYVTPKSNSKGDSQ